MSKSKSSATHESVNPLTAAQLDAQSALAAIRQNVSGHRYTLHLNLSLKPASNQATAPGDDTRDPKVPDQPKDSPPGDDTRDPKVPDGPIGSDQPVLEGIEISLTFSVPSR